jgi:hypothetical protein
MKRSVVAALAAALLVSAAPLPSSLPFGASPAVAQAALTVENLAVKSDKVELRIPKMTLEGSTATKADIEAIFGAKSLQDLRQNLTKLSARSIAIPLMELVQDTPEAKVTTQYRDTVMRDIRGGAIAEWVTGTMLSKGEGKPGKKGFPGLDLDAKDMVLKAADLPLMLRFMIDKAAPGEGLSMMVAEQSLGRTVYKIGDAASFTIDHILMKDFKARPLKKPMIELMADLEAKGGGKSKADETAGLLAAVDMFSAMSVGLMEMRGMKGEVPGANGKPPAKFGIERMSGAGGGDVNGRFAMHGLSVDSPDGKVKFGEFSIDGLDMSNLWKAFAAGAAKPDFNPSDIDPAEAIPKLGLFRIAGIDIDVPDPKQARERIKARLGLFETKMANHIGPIPADMTIAIDKLQMDIPANTSEKGLKDILALGYKAIDVSAKYDQAWDAAKKTLNLKEFSLRSVGMFNAKATAEIGNVTQEVFTLDKAKAAVAALAVAARSVQLNVVNEGLVEKLIAQQAKDQRRKPEDVRAEFAAGAALMMPMFMGDHPGAKVIGAALGKFLADPKNVQVKVTAKGDGVGAMDFLAAGNPLDVLKKVDIAAEANR